MVKRGSVQSEIAIDWKVIEELNIKPPEKLTIKKDELRYRTKKNFIFEFGSAIYACDSVKRFVETARNIFEELSRTFDGLPVKKVAIGSATRGRDIIIQVTLKNGNKYDISDVWIRRNTRDYLKKIDGEITIEEFARIIKESESIE